MQLADRPELVEGGFQLLIDATTRPVGESKRFSQQKLAKVIAPQEPALYRQRRDRDLLDISKKIRIPFELQKFETTQAYGLIVLLALIQSTIRPA